MTIDTKQLAALADEHLALLNDNEHDIWHHWDTRYRDAANPAAIKELCSMVEQAEADLAEAYAAMVLFEDGDMGNRWWDRACEVLDKARAFVEAQK